MDYPIWYELMCTRSREKAGAKKHRRKQKEEDYFGTSVYRDDEIAAIVLFADNLSEEDTYIVSTNTSLF